MIAGTLSLGVSQSDKEAEGLEESVICVCKRERVCVCVYIHVRERKR